MSPEALAGFVEAAAGSPAFPALPSARGRTAGGLGAPGGTSIKNPLPVDQDTLFVLGSVTKTYTATALMRLVAEAGSSWTRRSVGALSSGSRTSRLRRRSPC